MEPAVGIEPTTSRLQEDSRISPRNAARSTVSHFGCKKRVMP
jgi:hypothetical protein